MNDWTSKDFRKAAFAVGFGFFMGKFVMETIDGTLREVSRSIMKQRAENGSEYAQDVCRRGKIPYKTKETNDDEPKMKIGFC